MSKRIPAVKPNRAPRKPEAVPPPKPATEDARTLRHQLDQAADWIEGARAVFDELVFTVQDATAPRSVFTKKSLRRAGYDDAIEGMRCLRYAMEQIDAARGKVAVR